jgi:hypothetical protein
VQGYELTTRIEIDPNKEYAQCRYTRGDVFRVLLNPKLQTTPGEGEAEEIVMWFCITCLLLMCGFFFCFVWPDEMNSECGYYSSKHGYTICLCPSYCCCSEKETKHIIKSTPNIYQSEMCRMEGQKNTVHVIGPPPPPLIPGALSRDN